MSSEREEIPQLTPDMAKQILGPMEHLLSREHETVRALRAIAGGHKDGYRVAWQAVYGALGCPEPDGYKTLTGLSAALEEIERLKRVGRRYEWLHSAKTQEGTFICFRNEHGVSQLTGNFADAQIDKELAQGHT